jgi:hypothetical protein
MIGIDFSVITLYFPLWALKVLLHMETALDCLDLIACLGLGFSMVSFFNMEETFQIL